MTSEPADTSTQAKIWDNLDGFSKQGATADLQITGAHNNVKVPGYNPDQFFVAKN